MFGVRTTTASPTRIRVSPPSLLNKCFHNDHVIGIYFATDANMLLAIAEKCYKSTNKINAIIAGKQPAATWLTLDEARAELGEGCRRLGLGFHRQEQR